MKKLFVFLALAIMITALTGCSVTTKMVTRERVDQNLSSSSGNQGYLMGTPPPVGERKATKTYIEVQVEAIEDIVKHIYQGIGDKDKV